MDIVSAQQDNKVHPHKFILWVAIASIIMMFAGLTSAYIVKSGQANWQDVRLPNTFWYSTAILLISSITIQVAYRAIKQREMTQYRSLLIVTLVLGIVFVVLQGIGFSWLWAHGVHFDGAGAGQFLYILFGLHALHVVGGIIALIIIILKQYTGKTRSYNTVQAEVMST
jgi:cytochrome c oxidase subunit III